MIRGMDGFDEEKACQDPKKPQDRISMKGAFLKIGFATLLITLANCATINASVTGNFSQIDMQCGGYYPAIIQHWSGRLYGRTDGGGIYSSDNHGNTWTYLCGSMTTDAPLVPQGIAVPQTTNSSSNLILQACGVDYLNTDPGRGVWKSIDGGASWTQTLSGVNFSGGDNERIGGECIIFHPTNDSEAWVGSRGQGLYESLNAGSTWTRVAASTFTTNIFASICIHPSYPDQIFAGGDGGLWVSVNHGANWTLLKSFGIVQRVTRGADGTVYFGGVNGGSLLQRITSTNWSNTASYVFTDLMPAYGSDGNNMTCVTVLRDGRLVAGDFDNSTRVSSNKGTNFTTINYSYVSGSVAPPWTTVSYFGWRANSLIQDVSLTNTWYGGGGYGPMRTDDGGQHWQYICKGAGEVVTYRTTFHPTDPNRIYIPCADHAGAIVTDGGLSGNVVSMATPFFPWPGDIVMYSHRPMACYTNGVNRAIFPGGCELNNSARIYMTTNDGASWYYPAMAGLATNVSNQEIVDNVDSLDNPDDYLVILGGSAGVGAGGIYRTTNAGTSFRQCNWNCPAGADLGNEQYWFVSMDRDATNVNVRYLYSKAEYPGNPGGGFYISNDRGVNWAQVGGVVDNQNDWYGMIYADKAISGHVWLVVTGNTSGLFLSTNYGTNWTMVGSFKNVACMDAINGNIVVYGEMASDTWYKIYYSTNNGATWAEVTAPGYRFSNTSAVSLDPHRPGRIFIGTGERSVGIFTPGTPEQQWQLNYFMSTNSAQSANGADPDGNGLPNLVQYALGGDPLHGLSSDPLTGSSSGNATNWLPYATISSNSSLAGQPVMRVNLPDPPPADILYQALSSTDLVNWSTNATRNGTNAWQAISPALVLPGLDTNGRAIFDIGALPQDTNGGEYQILQVQLAH